VIINYNEKVTPVRIIVCIKQVPETKSVKMDEATGTVIREGVEAIINPLDLYAIELAIRLRDSYGGEVISISMGPPKAITALKEAIAMGVDTAILISDAGFAGSDTWATSHILAAAIRRITDYNLVICGERATDGDTGQVGPGLAAWLDLPVATYVSRISEINNRHCRLNRLVEDGYEQLTCQLPCVLTVVKEISQPRLPTLSGKLKAKAMQIPVWNNDTLQLDPAQVGLQGSPTRVVRVIKPKLTRSCRLVTAADETTAAQAAADMIAFLDQKQLL